MRLPEGFRRAVEGLQINHLVLGQEVPADLLALPTSPTLSLLFCFRDGVAYERAEEWGLSHFIEHILFRGTRSYPSLYALTRAIEQHGGKISAYSLRDMTAFWVHGPAGIEEQALAVLTELFTQPLLEPAAIAAEQEIIRQERLREQSNPGLVTSLLVEDLLLQPAPLSRYPLGSEAIIGAMAPAQLRRYLEAVYQRGNLAIAAAGRLGVGVVEELERAAGALGGGAVRAPVSFTVSSAAGERAVVILPAAQRNQVHLSLGWAVSLPSPELVYPWRVLNTLLGAGYTSLLNVALRERAGLTYLCTTRFNRYGERGVLKLSLALDAGALPRALTLIREVIRSVQDGSIGQQVFDEAKIRHAAHILFRLESPLEMAKMLGERLVRGGAPFSLTEYLDHVERITLADVSALAREQLTERQEKAVLLTGSPAARELFPDAAVLERDALVV